MDGTARCVGCGWYGPLSAVERGAKGYICWKCGSLVQAMVDPVSRMDGLKHQGLIARAGAHAAVQRDHTDRTRVMARLHGMEHDAQVRQARDRAKRAADAAVRAQGEVIRCEAAHVKMAMTFGPNAQAAVHAHERLVTARQWWLVAQRRAADAQEAAAETEAWTGAAYGQAPRVRDRERGQG